MHHTVKASLNLGEPLSYILGVLFGDGSCFKCNYIDTKGYFHNYNVIELKTKDESFADIFKKYCESIGLHPYLNKVKSKTTKQGFIFRTRAFSQNFVEWFKKNKNSIPNLILNSDKNNQIAFIKGLFDSEGCFSRGNFCGFFNTDLNLIKYYRILSKKLGFETSIITWGRSKGSFRKKILYCAYLLDGKEKIKEFLTLINPSIERKRWRECSHGRTKTFTRE